jgi:hypothetical protein
MKLTGDAHAAMRNLDVDVRTHMRTSEFHRTPAVGKRETSGLSWQIMKNSIEGDERVRSIRAASSVPNWTEKVTRNPDTSSRVAVYRKNLEDKWGKEQSEVVLPCCSPIVNRPS